MNALVLMLVMVCSLVATVAFAANERQANAPRFEKAGFSLRLG